MNHCLACYDTSIDPSIQCSNFFLYRLQDASVLYKFQCFLNIHVQNPVVIEMGNEFSKSAEC